MKTCSALLLTFLLSLPCFADAPYLGTGIKIGEVSDHDARVWVRLTKTEKRVGFEVPMPSVKYFDLKTGALFTERRPRFGRPELTYPDGLNIDTIQGAVPGSLGVVRVQYGLTESDATKKTPWHKVNTEDDFTTQFHLKDLQANAEYRIRVECKASEDNDILTATMEGSFKTAPKLNQQVPVSFAVSTGQDYRHLDSPKGYRLYDSILAKAPNFFVHTGDILYYDERAKNEALARWHWQRTYSLPSNVNFHRQVSSYFMKDDHDTLVNDCWPTMDAPMMGDLTFKQGLKIFREQVPMGKKTYRTVRWGKDLQIWMVEGRDFRSANTMPDGPEKTIWGAEQLAWFKRTVEASDATFRILISPTPVVGPDREGKNDNHANEGFAYEGNLLREFLATQKNIYVVCGDRHWQYVSVDQTHGVREYSCGPASIEHAQGWTNDMIRPEHQYLNVTGGFLTITVDRDADDHPTLRARHYSVFGKLLNEDIQVAH